MSGDGATTTDVETSDSAPVVRPEGSAGAPQLLAGGERAQRTSGSPHTDVGSCLSSDAFAADDKPWRSLVT